MNCPFFQGEDRLLTMLSYSDSALSQFFRNFSISSATFDGKVIFARYYMKGDVPQLNKGKGI